MTKPTVEALLQRGYFPKELPPEFSTDSLLGSIPDLTKQATHPTHPLEFSIPVFGGNGIRRQIRVPDPSSYCKLAARCITDWTDIEAVLNSSAIAGSRPKYEENSTRRAIGYSESRVHALQDTISKAPYLLKTDIANFYGSFYTHSIEWALRGKGVAKEKRGKGAGAELDIRVRACQDRESIGLAAGPDTSKIISELVLASRDAELQERVPAVSQRGFRWVDDFYFAAETRGEAENVLGHWEKLLNDYKLQLNSTKTVILEHPEPVEPEWLLQLSFFEFERNLKRKDNMLKFASLAHALAGRYKDRPVYSYAASKALRVMHELDGESLKRHWSSLLPFLITAAFADQSSLPKFHEALVLADGREVVSTDDLERIAKSMNQMCLSHATRNHGFEVSWALSILRLMEQRITSKAADQIAGMDDNFSRLLLCDAIKSERVDGDISIGAVKSSSSQEGHVGNWLFDYEVRRWDESPSNEGFWPDLHKTGATFMNLEVYEEDSKAGGIEDETEVLDDYIDDYPVHF